MIDDCMASLGKRLDEPWSDSQNSHLFELGGQYSRAVQENPFQDVLGMIYQELATNYGKKGLGQYFTPDHLAMVMAKIQYSSEQFEKPGVVTVCEPAVGSGVMLLAFMKNIMQEKPEFLRKLSVTGVDLDMTCVKMSVLQVLANNLIHSGNLGEIRMFQGSSLGDPHDLSLFYHASTPEFDELASIQKEKIRKRVGEKIKAREPISQVPLTPKRPVKKGQMSVFDFL